MQVPIPTNLKQWASTTKVQIFPNVFLDLHAILCVYDIQKYQSCPSHLNITVDTQGIPILDYNVLYEPMELI